MTILPYDLFNAQIYIHICLACVRLFNTNICITINTHTPHKVSNEITTIHTIRVRYTCKYIYIHFRQTFQPKKKLTLMCDFASFKFFVDQMVPYNSPTTSNDFLCPTTASTGSKDDPSTTHCPVLDKEQRRMHEEEDDDSKIFALCVHTYPCKEMIVSCNESWHPRDYI